MDIHGRQLQSAKQHQVFVNFRGDELRFGFVSHLVEALQRHQINVFIDKLERIGEDLTNLFVRIEESTIALVIFSRRYTESRWCLDELVKINQLTDQGLLKVIPIFFKVEPVTVKQLRGAFGDQFRDREWEYRCDKPRTERWRDALASVSCKIGLTFEKKSNESEFVKIIVKEVKKMVQPQENYVVVPFPGIRRRRDTSSHGRQCQEEQVVLSRESAVLVQENSKIANQIAVVSMRYMDIESENSVIRAQLGELSERLQSLNSIIEVVEGVVGKVPEIPEFLMNPWQIMSTSSQPITASADMFYYP
ncbi:PREDICTED: protein PHLOEM PROTEIN 2-LIKE A8 [Camelina sativa]|uniref:Protein PHLOEM PROTEIN 2-LIKE A8 n=1 Tax=Camelina sativa TaxID=90675 RepID=A0ABM0X6W4_CAMSA|nr:PREDICTED: protein PHLOEM PROTEIN 2-LIKE A8 [Camelina sativa]